MGPHMAKGLGAEECEVRRHAGALGDEILAVPVVRPHPGPLQAAVEQQVARLILDGLHPAHHVRHTRPDRQQSVTAVLARRVLHRTRTRRTQGERVR